MAKLHKRWLRSVVLGAAIALAAPAFAGGVDELPQQVQKWLATNPGELNGIIIQSASELGALRPLKQSGRDMDALMSGIHGLVDDRPVRDLRLFQRDRKPARSVRRA